MTGLPSGTVTFLFTDIEGSTRLWDRDHAAMAQALARHDELLREVVASNGGSIFKLVGDAVFAAFPTAPAALAAALAGQRALAAEPWGDLGPIRVRMALHTATVEPHDGDYTGPPLNRVARLLAAGHGGQVLLSAATQHLVSQHLPPDTTLLDLGMHRLRDLLEPEHVYQLVADGLDTTLPPLKSLEHHPTNLPLQPTPLIGRDQELADLEALLSRDEVRLVTLTGPGGTGKTRLALQVAADLLEPFPDGVYVVDLSPLTDPALVVGAIAATVGVHERGGRSLSEALVAALTDQRMLLLLDNFEQLLPAAPVLADLLSACPTLKILVTSRARLGLRAEHDYLVPPLATPDLAHVPPLPALAQIPAVALFVHRATAVRHDFALTEHNAAVVAAICARLDGLPLAIELAAARVRLLPPKAILQRLTNRLHLLTGGARDLPQRHQTLRTTIAWSYELLAAEEQALFRRLAVFAGGFSLEAAETVVCAAGLLDLDILDGVAALVDQSLLRQRDNPDGEPRFTLLETLREFGLGQLDAAGETMVTRRTHAEWCLELAEMAAAHLTGPDQGFWLARLAGEHDNLRAALAFLATASDADGNEDEAELRLAGALWRFWYMRGHLSEGRAALDRALARAAALPTAARATALNAYGAMAYTQGDLDQARTFFEESLTIRRALNDTSGVANSLNNLAIVADEQGDYARAMDIHAESLELRRELDDQYGVAISLNNMGIVAHMQGDYRRAAALHQESLAIRRAIGSKDGIASSLHNLASATYELGDYSRAADIHTESLEIMRELGDKRGVAIALHNLGKSAHVQGDARRAIDCYRENLATLRELGDKRSLIDSLEGIASIAASSSLTEQATRLLGAAAALRDELGVPATSVERKSTDHTLAAARAQLGEPVLVELLASGRSLGVERAITTASTVLQEAERALASS